MTELLKFDPLTGLPNFLSFELQLAEALAQYTEDAGLIALIAIDVDHFKTINDRFGLAASDEVLKSIAGLLQSFTGKQETVYRFPSDQFVVLCIETTLDRPQFFEDLIVREVSRLKVFCDQTDMGPFSVTTGHALCPHDGCRRDDLLNAAYAALRRKKRDR